MSLKANEQPCASFLLGFFDNLPCGAVASKDLGNELAEKRLTK